MAKHKKPTFVPSTGDEDYMQPAGSKQPTTPRYHGLDAVDLTMLNSLATDINKCIDQTQKVVARAQIKVGKLLLEARALFPGDKEFGQWRAENTEIKSRQTAHALMRVAEKFGSAPKLLDAMNYTQLVELVSAPESLVKEIEIEAAGGKQHTVKEIRERKASVPSTGHKVGKTSKALAKKVEDRDPEAEALDLMLSDDLTKRLNHNNAYVQLGLYPFGGPPNEYVLIALEQYWENQHDHDNIEDHQLDRIYQALHKIRKEIKDASKRI